MQMSEMRYYIGDRVVIVSRLVAGYILGSTLEATEGRNPLLRRMYGKEFEIFDIRNGGYTLRPINAQDFNLDERDMLERMIFTECFFVVCDSFTYNLLYGGDM